MSACRRNLTFTLGLRAARVVLIGVAFAACVYFFVCLQSFRAEQLADSPNVDDLIHATRLAPGNAMNWQSLGLAFLYQYNDPESSLPAFQRALQLNPHDADSWIGTAYALQFLGRPDEERLAVSRALEAEPNRLEISWQAANLYAVMGDREAMMKQICGLVAHDRARLHVALDLARKITGSEAVECGQPGKQQ